MQTINLFKTDAAARTVTVNLDNNPEGKQVKLVLDVYDMDRDGECVIFVNDRRFEPLIGRNIGANNEKTVQIDFTTAGGHWKKGDNKVRVLRDDDGHGFRITIKKSVTASGQAITHKIDRSDNDPAESDDETGGGDTSGGGGNTGAGNTATTLTLNELGDATKKGHERNYNWVPKNYSFYATPNPYNGTSNYNEKFDFVNSMPKRGSENFDSINDWNHVGHFNGDVTRDGRHAVVEMGSVTLAIKHRNTGEWHVWNQGPQKFGYVHKKDSVTAKLHSDVVKYSKGDDVAYVGRQLNGWATNNAYTHGWSGNRRSFKSNNIGVIVWWLNARVVDLQGRSMSGSKFSWADQRYVMCVGGDVFYHGEGRGRRGCQGRHYILNRNRRCIFHTNSDRATWKKLIDNKDLPKGFPLA